MLSLSGPDLTISRTTARRPAHCLRSPGLPWSLLPGPGWLFSSPLDRTGCPVPCAGFSWSSPALLVTGWAGQGRFPPWSAIIDPGPVRDCPPGHGRASPCSLTAGRRLVMIEVPPLLVLVIARPLALGILDPPPPPSGTVGFLRSAGPGLAARPGSTGDRGSPPTSPDRAGIPPSGRRAAGTSAFIPSVLSFWCFPLALPLTSRLDRRPIR